MILPYARDFFSQPLCAFLLVLTGFGLLESTQGTDPRPFWVAILSASLLPWARMDMGVVLVGLFLWVFLDQRKESKQAPPIGTQRLIFLFPLLISLVFLFLFDRYRWGRWGGAPYGDHSFNVPLVDSLPRFLVSPELSVFLYNPLLLVSFGILAVRWKKMKPMGCGLLAMDLLYLVLIGKFRDYHGGVCPGPRYLLSLVPLNLFPLFLGLSRMKQSRRPVFGLIAVCGAIGIAINGYEALVDYTSAPPAWDYWMNILTHGITG